MNQAIRIEVLPVGIRRREQILTQTAIIVMELDEEHNVHISAGSVNATQSTFTWK